MREGCTKRKLGDVISLEYGKPLPPDQRRTDGGFPAYGANGIKCFAANPYFDDPSIIVGRKGTAGAVNLVEGGFWPLDVTYYVTFDRDQHDLRFLYYMLSALDLPSLATGVKPGINRNVVYSIEHYFPPLPEQKRIVAILDEAFAGIATAVANTEKNLANARELFESYLNWIFTRQGWSVATVDDVCESIVDCVNKTAPTTNVETSFKMIRTTNVRDGRIDLSSVKYVSEEVFKVWTRRQAPRRGDVILTREAPLGEVGLIDTDDKIFLGQRLVSYRTDPLRLNNRFLLYAFQSQLMQSQIRSLASGSTVQHMRVPDSKRLALPVPSMREQMSAVERLDSLRAGTDEIALLYQCKLSALAELKQSLLQQAFSGELTASKKASDVIRKAEAVA